MDTYTHIQTIVYRAFEIRCYKNFCFVKTSKVKKMCWFYHGIVYILALLDFSRSTFEIPTGNLYVYVWFSRKPSALVKYIFIRSLRSSRSLREHYVWSVVNRQTRHFIIAFSWEYKCVVQRKRKHINRSKSDGFKWKMGFQRPKRTIKSLSKMSLMIRLSFRTRHTK